MCNPSQLKPRRRGRGRVPQILRSISVCGQRRAACLLSEGGGAEDAIPCLCWVFPPRRGRCRAARSSEAAAGSPPRRAHSRPCGRRVPTPFPSRAVVSSGNSSRLATRNVFHFYDDSVPKDKDSHPKGALLPLVCMHASDRSGNVRGHQPQTQNSPWSRNGGAGERTPEIRARLLAFALRPIHIHW